MYTAAEHTSLFIRRVLEGKNKSYQHVVMAAQAFHSAVEQMLNRAFNKVEGAEIKGRQSCGTNTLHLSWSPGYLG